MSQVQKITPWAPGVHLDLARELYAVLTDGAPASGYHLRRGLCLRDATTRRPLPSSYTAEWRPARDRQRDGTLVDRKLSPHVLAQHLAGKYDVAWQFPGWTSLVVFDIDLPSVPPSTGERSEERFLRELHAARKRDEVLAQIWRAFALGEDRPPVILSTPGGGYHVYLPICRGPTHRERTWPAAWIRARIEAKLAAEGLRLRPGELELFPAGNRLRAPCGAKMALLDVNQPEDPDDLLLVPAFGRRQARRCGDRIERVWVRQIHDMTRAFLDRIESTRRPLDEWLGDASVRWDAVRGPFGAASFRRSSHVQQLPGRSVATQDNVDVLGMTGAPSRGRLLYGKAFLDRIGALSLAGLEGSGLRHDAALKLCWYWGVCLGLSWSEVRLRLLRWLGSLGHVSSTRARSAVAFRRETLREAAHYFLHHVLPRQRVGGRALLDFAPLPVPSRDAAVVLPRIDSGCRPEAEKILRFLYAHSDASGRVCAPLALSSAILGSLCGDRRVRERRADGRLVRRRATTLAIASLVRMGVLSLQTDYSTGRHGRIYRCWYLFGSARLPGCDRVSSGFAEQARVSPVHAAGSGPVPRSVPRPAAEGPSRVSVSVASPSPWTQRYQRLFLGWTRRGPPRP